MKMRAAATATFLLLVLGSVGETVIGVASDGSGGWATAAWASTKDVEGGSRRGVDLQTALASLGEGPGHDHDSHDHGPDEDDLAPWHADPPPPGVDLDAPTDTRSLYRRAGLPLSWSTTTRTRPEDAATVPPGNPVVPGLTEHVAPSCTGTGTNGKRVQVLYAHEVGTTSRYDAMLPLFRHEVATVDDIFAVSAAKTAGGRRVRWVHDADCVPVILPVVLPAGSLGPDFRATVNALKAAGFGRSDRKYLVFSDANELCGIASYYEDARTSGNWNDGAAASYSRVDRRCWTTGSVSTLAHELTHNLGGVLETAPHATSYGHCDDEWDLMCYDDGSGIPMRNVCATTHRTLLDCRDDDYFSTAPPAGSFLATSWNTASSGFLDVVPVLGEEPAPAPGPSPDPDPGPVATDLRASVRHSPTTRVRAVLSDDGGAGLSGRQVELQRRLPGRTNWVLQATRTTSDVGRTQLRVPATRPATYRWVHRATATTGRSVSNPVRVRG